LYNIEKQKGASLVEAIFVIPLFLIMVGAIFEVGYIYRSKTTLNSATIDAAREGAVTNISKADMRQTLAAGMLPLYTSGSVDSDGILDARDEALEVETELSALATLSGLDTLDILSPNRSIYNAFMERIPLLVGQRVELVDAIPNDNLMYRSTDLKSVTVNGQSVRMNIQDANLIKIKSFWCHRLKIPGLRDAAKRLIFDSPLVSTTSEQMVCNDFGEQENNGRVYVAITAQAITRSQSPIFSDDLN